MAPFRARLEEFDIKVAVPYSIGKTTHVVQSKRNTAKGLQALINGKYIVTESFVDALIYATTPEDLDELESLSPLEVDFDKHWPDALQHLPPRGKEPTERPSEAFAPDPSRINVFEGYTFVFCEQAQFDTLQAPITNGGGKALIYSLESFKTTTEDLVRYVKGVAGEKGLGELEDGSDGKGVVVVKFRGGKDDYDWTAQLATDLALALDLRLIEQNEFMDAILINDATVLRRHLPEEEDEGTGTFHSLQLRSPANKQYVVSNTDQATNQHRDVSVDKQSQANASQSEADQNQTRRRERGKYQRRFKGFEDEDDEEDVNHGLISGIPAESQLNNDLKSGRSRRNLVRQ